MKSFSIATIFLTAAALSSLTSVSAKNNSNDQCVHNLPPHTSARPYGRNYMFTQADTPWVGGPVPSTKCSGRKTKGYTNIHSADKCASTCANADANNSGSRSGRVLLGYNYNCRTKKCDCIMGNEKDDIGSTVKKEVSGDWACYEADSSFSSPTPAPTPAQCTLPPTASGSAFGPTYIFTRVEPQRRSTTCNVGNSFLPFQADNVEQCANKCAAKQLPGGAPGSKQMIGFDYNCDSMKCTCLTGSGSTNLQQNVQLTTENMACYLVSAIGVGEEEAANQMDAKQFLRANVVQIWD